MDKVYVTISEQYYLDHYGNPYSSFPFSIMDFDSEEEYDKALEEFKTPEDEQRRWDALEKYGKMEIYDGDGESGMCIPEPTGFYEMSQDAFDAMCVNENFDPKDFSFRQLM